jgi:hypothetical protein
MPADAEAVKMQCRINMQNAFESSLQSGIFYKKNAFAPDDGTKA